MQAGSYTLMKQELEPRQEGIVMQARKHLPLVTYDIPCPRTRPGCPGWSAQVIDSGATPAGSAPISEVHASQNVALHSPIL